MSSKLQRNLASIPDLIDAVCDMLEEADRERGMVALREICKASPLVAGYLQISPERVIRWVALFAPEKYRTRVQPNEALIVERIKEYQKRLRTKTAFQRKYDL